MSQNDTAKKSNEVKDSAKLLTSTVTKKNPKLKRSNWALWLLFGVVGGAVSLGAFVFYVGPLSIGSVTIGKQEGQPILHKVDDLFVEFNDFKQRFSVLKSQLTTIEQPNDDNQLQTRIDQLRDETEQLQQAVILLQNKVVNQNEVSKPVPTVPAIARQTWLLDEVGYLIRLAQQRIIMGQDMVGAKRLLLAADDLLAANSDLSLYAIREALAKDVAAIENISQLDVNEIYLAIHKLIQKVDNMELLPDFHGVVEQSKDQLEQVPVNQGIKADNQNEEVIEKDLSEEWTDIFKQTASNTWQEIKSLITIRRTDELIEPLLLPEQEYYLRLNLYLMLEQTQLALLMGEQTIYKESLDKVSAWIRKYFQLESEALADTLVELSELKKIEFNQSVINISATEKAIKQHLIDLQKTPEKIITQTLSDTEVSNADENIKIMPEGESP